jgi:hypothetical protein
MFIATPAGVSISHLLLRKWRNEVLDMNRRPVFVRELLTGGEGCIAFTRRVANGFAQSKTDSQESEG